MSIRAKYKTVLLFFIAISFTTKAQSNKEIDSIKQLIATVDNDSLKQQWYNQLRRMTHYSDIDESMNYTRKFLELSQKRNDSLSIAFGQFYLGNGYFEKSNYNESLENYLKAADYFEKTKDSIRLASVLNGIGGAYEKNGNDSISLKYYLQSFEISEGLKDNRRSALALNNIANIYKNRGNVEQSIKHLEEAVIKLTDKDIQYLNPIRVNLANSYNDNGETRRAETIYNEILSNINKDQDAFTYIVAINGLGKIALEREEYTKAVSLLEESYKTATEKKYFEQRYDVMRNLIDAYNYSNNHKQALDLFYEYHIIKDSIFTSEKDKNLSEAIQKYEAEKKDLIISQQQSNTEKQARIKNLFLLGAILFAALSLMIYIFFRKRLKYQKAIADKNKQLQLQKIIELEQNQKLVAMNSMVNGQEAERKRIAKDLHDGLGGLLSTVKAHFEGLKNTKPEEKTSIYTKTGELIDHACIEVRRISHNMMPHALSLSGLESAITDLGESLSEEGINTTIEITEIPVPIDEGKTVMIYRLVQELMANIRKHAKAKNVLLQLLNYEDTLILTIEDDGKGFDLEVAKHGDGLGLKSIYSRVEFLNGTIEIDSESQRGTTVIIEIPIP